MAFQLVRASDDEIAVWHVEHGHIFVFQICEGATRLKRGFVREAPDASEPAAIFFDDAEIFATGEARSRLLIA